MEKLSKRNWLNKTFVIYDVDQSIGGITKDRNQLNLIIK